VLRLFFGLSALALVEGVPGASPPPAHPAWPHRAILTSPDGRPAAFRAYTLGGVFIITVDSSGQYTIDSSDVPRVRELTAKDTVRASVPADFPLDLSKGPVVFVAEGRDTLQIAVGRNPYGRIDQVRATGRMFTVRMDGNKFVIDKQ
jgi:hypothetical protein